MTPDSTDKPLYREQLAAACGVSPWYISMMKRAGFRMPSHRATVSDFWAWHRERPTWCAKRQRPPTPANGGPQMPTPANA